MTLLEGLKYLVPIIAGIVASVLGSAFIGPRNLRRDLAADSEMLERLPSTAQQELRHDLERRALILVSLSRFPSLGAFDVLGLFGLLAIGGIEVWFAVSFRDQAGIPLDSLILVSTAWSSSAICWMNFYRPWSERAAERIDYIERHIGTAEAEEVSRVMRIGMGASMQLGLAGIAGPTIGLLFACFDDVEGPEWVVPVFGLAVVAVTVLAVYLGIYGLRRTPDTGRLVKRINQLVQSRREAERAASTGSGDD